MTEWVTVVALILVGLALIIAEIIFVPGGIIGIIGLLCVGFGVYQSYTYFGSETGTWVAAVSAVLFGLSLYLSFKQGAWNRFSLKDTNAGKVNEGLTSKLKVGDTGVAMSAIRPMGKAEFHHLEYEVRSMGNYINSGTTIKIIKIDSNNIFVEPIN